MTKPHGRIWRFLTMLLILILAGLIAYLGVIGMLVWKMNHVPSTDHYDAIVVLGAQVKADGTLSLQLQWRLDAACDAWEKNNVMIVRGTPSLRVRGCQKVYTSANSRSAMPPIRYSTALAASLIWKAVLPDSTESAFCDV